MRDLVRVLLRAKPQLIDAKAARESWALHRIRNGWGPVAQLLTPPDGNAKFAKTTAKVFGLSLAQADTSGEANACRYSTPECRRGCVSFAGKGELPKIQAARALKVRFLLADPNAFVTLLSHEITRAKERYGADSVVVRLNTFSDIPWEQIVPWLFVLHADVQFYDYTKWPKRVTPANYDLTYSASEYTMDENIVSACNVGERVAVVFKTRRGQPLPTEWRGVSVVDGDKSDDRHADPRGVIVGLRAKGRMRRGEWEMAREAVA